MFTVNFRPGRLLRPRCRPYQCESAKGYSQTKSRRLDAHRQTGEGKCSTMAKAVRALWEGFYTLTQAAQILGVDNKTLQKRLTRAGIEPVRREDDRRLRLLTEEQIEHLRGVLDQTPTKVPRAKTPLGET